MKERGGRRGREGRVGRQGLVFQQQDIGKSGGDFFGSFFFFKKVECSKPVTHMLLDVVQTQLLPPPGHAASREASKHTTTRTFSFPNQVGKNK